VKKLNRASAPGEDYPVKVLQFGDGNFLRGFADWMIDVLNAEKAFRASVVIAAPLRRGKPPVHDDQDGRYHVVLRGISGGKRIDDVRLIHCLNGYIDPYSEYVKLMQVAELPSLQFIISNTTEAGISFNPDDTQADAAPDSFPAKVAQLLYRRYQAFQGDRSKGIILLPCELIEDNGKMLKKFVLQYAELWKLPSGFVEWVNNACQFCDTLVDRIVTGYPQDYAQEIMQRTGYQDGRIVAAEPYHLWVIEAGEQMNNAFPVQGTALNVKFVSNLAPYRTSKVRILNGAHTAMTLVGYLRGHRTVRETVEDLWMSKFLQDMIREEIIPTIPLPYADVERYASSVFERFHNPEIKHELKSIALNSTSKFRARLLPTLLDRYQKTRQLPPHILHVFAALVVFYRRDRSWLGDHLPVSDHPDALKAFDLCWRNPLTPDLSALLSNVTLWGTDLAQIEGLESSLLDEITLITREDE
jgi:tagaturonate reductase